MKQNRTTWFLKKKEKDIIHMIRAVLTASRKKKLKLALQCSLFI